jgi:hypothetical protein
MFSPWRYSKDEGWKELKTLLEAAHKDDADDELSECGFFTEPTIQIGVPEKFHVMIHTRLTDGKVKEVKDDFVAIVVIGETSHQVALPHLPDLLSFLSQVTPICDEIKRSESAKKK